jgi:peroxiredoxin
MIKTLFITCALFAATTGLGFAEVEIGKATPNFTLPDTNGKTHSLADFKGKYVVLEWYQPDCPFVGKQYRSGNMQSLQKEYTGKGVVWLSIDSSAPGEQGNYPADKLNEFAAKDARGPDRLVAGSGR